MNQRSTVVYDRLCENETSVRPTAGQLRFAPYSPVLLLERIESSCELESLGYSPRCSVWWTLEVATGRLIPVWEEMFLRRSELR